MSTSHKSHWFERWWPLFLAAFGISFILFLACFKPTP